MSSLANELWWSTISHYLLDVPGMWMTYALPHIVRSYNDILVQFPNFKLQFSSVSFNLALDRHALHSAGSNPCDEEAEQDEHSKCLNLV